MRRRWLDDFNRSFRESGMLSGRWTQLNVMWTFNPVCSKNRNITLRAKSSYYGVKIDKLTEESQNFCLEPRPAKTLFASLNKHPVGEVYLKQGIWSTASRCRRDDLLQSVLVINMCVCLSVVQHLWGVICASPPSDTNTRARPRFPGAPIKTIKFN